MPAKIIIFEDEGVTALHLESTLTRSGFEVAAVSETAENIEELVRTHGPDLVVMDVRLKGAVDGVEAAALLEDRFDLPVVIVTAHSDQRTRTLLESGAVHALVVKPFEEREILVAVRSALHRCRLERALAAPGAVSAPRLSAFGDCVLATDSRGRILYMNEPAEQLTGWSTIDAFEREASDVIRLNLADDGELISHPVSVVLRDPGGSRDRAESVLTARTGSQVPVSHHVTPVRDDAGEILGAVVTIRRRQDEAETTEVAAGDLDALTGLMTRSELFEELRDAVARARDRHTLLAVFCIDFDDTRPALAALGTEAADRLSAAVASRLKSFVRSTDLAARLGPTRFAFVLTDVDRTSSVVAVSDKLLRLMDEPFTIDATGLAVRPAIGVSLYPTDTSIPNRLLEYAEHAARRVRTSDRDRCAFHSEDMESAAAVERSLGDGLAAALEGRRLELLYRPVCDLSSRATVSAEIRPVWRHPERGTIPDSVFIPVADRRGELAAITDWMMAEAIARAASWQGVCPGARASIRLPSSELAHPRLVPRLLEILEGGGARSAWLEIAACETSLVARPTRTVQLNLQRLRQLGIRLTLDNFGAEYASMISLRRLPVHRVKMDRTLVASAVVEPEANAIVRATIDLARGCGLEIAADGVETEAQWRWLRYHGCEFGQGDFFGASLNASELFDRLVEQRR